MLEKYHPPLIKAIRKEDYSVFLYSMNQEKTALRETIQKILIRNNKLGLFSLISFLVAPLFSHIS